MLCPSCFSIMTCRTTINSIPGQAGRERMSLHCSNSYCSARCHMEVLTEDSKIWECHQYGFSFDFDKKHYLLTGHNYAVDVLRQNRNPHSQLTSLALWEAWPEYLVSTDFIPISTSDDMHEEAWKLFHRLRKLICFS